MVRLPKFSPRLLLDSWNRLKAFPAGNRVFSRLIGVMVPYSGSTDPVVESLEPGYARVRLHDKRAVRNHLQSIHAMALANIGELSTGLALNTALPETARAILTGFSVEYLKKARGTLTVECRVEPLQNVTERKAMPVSADIRDAQDVVVARVHAQWLVGPKS